MHLLEARKNYENSRIYPEVDAFLDYSNIFKFVEESVGVLQLKQYELPTHQAGFFYHNFRNYLRRLTFSHRSSFSDLKEQKID